MLPTVADQNDNNYFENTDLVSETSVCKELELPSSNDLKYGSYRYTWPNVGVRQIGYDLDDF